MPALVAGIHVCMTSQRRKTWMAGTSPAMTADRLTQLFRDESLVGLDVGHLNHLAPFHSLVGDEFAEIGWRACKHRCTQISKPRHEFWIFNADIDFLVQYFGDLSGRVFRGPDSELCTCLVAR
jgi:hypothetical protein